MDNIGIFCSASNEIDAIYTDNVKTLGKWLGTSEKTVICGGIKTGLMEIIAKTTSSSGGKVIGVVPDVMKERISSYLQEVVYVRDLSERKDKFLELADIIIVLPGGVGTLDEAFHVMSCTTLGYNNKKLVFYNINGFFSNLLTCLAEFKKDGFISCPISDLFIIANTESELKSLLK